MKITAIILAHYKERENNLKRMIDDLLGGTVVPQEVIIFIDNPDIAFTDDRVTIIRSSQSFLPIVRFALGLVCKSDYCFFLDDDLSVRRKTLENFVNRSYKCPFDSILGLEGNKLGNTKNPYLEDTPIQRKNHESPVLADIIIRTYFVPVRVLLASHRLMFLYPDLPKESLDDIYLCLGNKYLNEGSNYIIPVNEETDLIELPDGGVGQSRAGNHYKNRNEVCRKLMDIYE